MRVVTQSTFGNLQWRQFNCSSCRCLYRINFVVVLFVIYPNIILQRQSYVFEFGYYYAHTSALSMIRHRVDPFFKDGEYALSNSAGNMEANLKKRRKLHEYAEQE